jgi:hypothetical protein
MQIENGRVWMYESVLQEKGFVRDNIVGDGSII